MTCSRADHYPQPDGGELGEAHLHAAGRVQLVDGVPAVVDGSACSPRRWRTIVVDPPWAYTVSSLPPSSKAANGNRSRAAAENYSTMTIEELAVMPLDRWAENDAHIYVWTTNAFMQEAHTLVRAWGFVQKTIITWVKPQVGMGHYYRNTTEHVLFGVRGKLPALRADCRTDFTANRSRHSEKPQAFYDMVETMSPSPYLDVFARKQRMGWDVAGNEVYSAIPELAYKPPQATDATIPANDVLDQAELDCQL